MKILINNKQTETETKSLSELAAELNLPERGVAVAVSNKMVPRTEWEGTLLTEGANVVIIKAACGG
ncbi:MAG: sulfur carrier protein ThiS [Prevotellaceae bacterium]|nr:sulfur carrier protein ThiS [Candidatus Minthosoma equi]